MATSHFTKFLESFDADNNRRGKQWEHVCKWFLETDPVYRARLKKVWLWKEWPDRPYDNEAGIDLVAQEKNGNLWAIQAKAYAANRPVNKDDMDKFISESEGDQFSLRLLLATSYKVGRNVTRLIDRYTPPLVIQMRHDLDQREGLKWPASFSDWATGRIPKKTPFLPLPHQTSALRVAIKKLKDHDRGQLIYAFEPGIMAAVVM